MSSLLSLWLPVMMMMNQLLVPSRPAVSAEKITLQVDASRYINLNGFVGPELLPQADNIIALATKNTNPIYISLNGPGGYVSVQEVIVEAMEIAKSRGVPLVCFTTVMAMSATFNMLTHCTTRVALPGAVFLFHPIRTGVREPLRAVDAMQIALALGKWDKELVEGLCRTMVGPGKCRDVGIAYRAERVWTALELSVFAVAGWITIVDDIQNVKDLFVFTARNGMNLKDIPGYQGEGILHEDIH